MQPFTKDSIAIRTGASESLLQVEIVNYNETVSVGSTIFTDPS
jgi:hypothetical protein